MEFEYGEIYPFDEEGVNYSGTSWYELVGLDTAKQKLEQFVKAILQQSFFEDTRLPFRPSILLQGPPGTGKTALTLAFGQKEKFPIIILLTTKIIRAKLGQSGENLSNAFAYVKDYAIQRKKPLILFIDEFDSFARQRDDVQEIGEIKRLVNSLLTELDVLIAQHKNIILIAATNHANTIDRAAFRRFAIQIDFTIPAPELRHHIWSEFHRRIQLRIPECKWDLDTLVERTEGYTAADIERIVLSAAIEYIHQDLDTINTELLLQQLRYVTPTSKHMGKEELSDLLDLDSIDLRKIKGITDGFKTQASRL